MTTAASAVALAAAVVSYGLATLQLSHAARDGRVLHHPRWWFGVALQCAGFVLTFSARHQLPLLLVQPILTTSLVVTTATGAAMGLWRLGRGDVLRCLLVVAGVAMLASAARPGTADALHAPAATALVVAELLAVSGLLRPPSRFSLRHQALWRGACAGLAFGSGAVSARALAADPLTNVRTSWGVLAVVLLVGGSLIGQAALTTSLRGGHVGGPVSAMYVVSTVAPAAAGLLWIGDQMADNGWPLAVLGTAAALVGSLGLASHGHGDEDGQPSDPDDLVTTGGPRG